MKNVISAFIFLMSFIGPAANALTWTAANTPDAFYEDVAYGNGVFVLVGPAYTVSSTDNGITWGNAFNTTAWNTGLAFGAGLFVAAGPNVLTTSPDGVNWTMGSWPAWYPNITYGGGLFVAVGGYDEYSAPVSAIRTSPNGNTWTDQTSPVSSPLASVAYGNGKYVAVAYSGTTAATATAQAIYSSNAINWTAATTPVQSDWQSVAFGNNVFVAVSASGLVMTTIDGITWTQRSSPSGSWSDVTFGNGTFVAVSSAGSTLNSVMTSTDGINWTIGQAPTLSSWTAVGFGNNYFVSVSTAYAEMRSLLVTNPTAVTNGASAITRTAATLHGTVNGGGGQTTVTFDYGTSLSYGSVATATQSPLAEGASTTGVSARISGLTCNTPYFYRVSATNSAATTIGNPPRTFTTHSDCTRDPATLSVTNSPQNYTGLAIAAAVSCSSGGTVSNVLYNGSSAVPSAEGTYEITANCAANAGDLPLINASAGNFLISYPVVPVVSIPTLSEWSQMLLGLMVLSMIGWHFHKQRSY